MRLFRNSATDAVGNTAQAAASKAVASLVNSESFLEQIDVNAIADRIDLQRVVDRIAKEADLSALVAISTNSLGGQLRRDFRSIFYSVDDVFDRIIKRKKTGSAGLVTRSAAFVTDALILVSAYLLALWSISVTRFLVSPAELELVDPSPWVSAVLIPVLLLTYFTAAWSTSGATAGQRLLGIWVTDRNGKKLRVPSSFARAALISFLPGLCAILIPFTHLGIHDLLARSKVQRLGA